MLNWSGEATEERLGGENETLQFLPRRQASPRGMNRWGDGEDWMPRERAGGLAAGGCCGRTGGWLGGREVDSSRAAERVRK